MEVYNLQHLSHTQNTHLRENLLRDSERVAGVERRGRVAHETAAGRHVWPDVPDAGRGGAHRKERAR